MSDYPECDKWAEVSPQIFRFIEHLESRGVYLASYGTKDSSTGLIQCTESLDQLICNWRGIDPKALERERREILKKQCDAGRGEGGQ